MRSILDQGQVVVQLLCASFKRVFIVFIDWICCNHMIRVYDLVDLSVIVIHLKFIIRSFTYLQCRTLITNTILHSILSFFMHVILTPPPPIPLAASVIHKNPLTKNIYLLLLILLKVILYSICHLVFFFLNRTSRTFSDVSSS